MTNELKVAVPFFGTYSRRKKNAIEGILKANRIWTLANCSIGGMSMQSRASLESLYRPFMPLMHSEYSCDSATSLVPKMKYESES